MKSRGGKSQGREERKKEDQKRKSLRRKKTQVREKVGKSRNAVFSNDLGVRRVKNARRCGAKHMSKSKCTKHTRFGPLLEVQMSKKCTPLWREAHFEVKSAKAEGFGALFDV